MTDTIDKAFHDMFEGPTDTPKVIPTYSPAPEVEAVAAALMERFAGFTHLHEHRLTYLWDSRVPKPRGKCDTIGKVHKVNDLWHSLTGIDAVVVINLPFWATADDTQRQALVWHELSHLETDEETGVLRTIGHDLEMFVGEARWFGDWRRSITDVAENLTLWRDSTAR